MRVQKRGILIEYQSFNSFREDEVGKRMEGGPSPKLLILGLKETNLVSCRVMTLGFMTLQRINITSSTHI